jgi:hypothetical protein
VDLFLREIEPISYFLLGSLSPDTGAVIPTVTDNLFTSGVIASNEIGISFEPIADPSGAQFNGELTWGTYTFIDCIIGIIVLTDSVVQVEPTTASTLAQLRTCMYFVLNHY